MKQFCELTKPVSNEHPSMINIKLQKICNNNEKSVDKSIKSEELKLSKTSCLSQNNKSLKIENMSTNSQQDLTMYNAKLNNIKVNLQLCFIKNCFV